MTLLRLKARWVMLSLRERVLILIMGALLAVVIVWYGLIRPIEDGLARAKADHVIAVERAGRIAATVSALKGARGSVPALVGSLDQVVAQSAGEAGFTLDTANQEGPDRMSIAIAAARAPALFAWLGALEQRGVQVETITVTPGAGGTVATRATLRKAAP